LIKGMILLLKVGRNDPCPCGSGKKYKKCCMPKDEEHELASQKDEENPPDEKKKHPRSDEIENNLHRAYNLLDEGDFNQAARVFKSVVLMDHNNYKALTGYGKCLAETGMIEEACKYFEKALEINPDYTQANLNLALYRKVL
jgi:tetratricopeptide (TPR) repeat protein